MTSQYIDLFNQSNLIGNVVADSIIANTVQILGLPPSSVVTTDSTSTLAATPLTNGQLLIGRTGNSPLANTLAAVANQTVIVNGPGTITVGTAQDINTTSNPTFNNLTLTGNLAATGTVTGSNLSGTNTGDVTLTPVGAAPNANGASLAGQAITLQPADNTNPGVLTALAQSIGGNKTFSGLTSMTTTYTTATPTLAITGQGTGVGTNSMVTVTNTNAAAGTLLTLNTSSTGSNNIMRIVGNAAFTGNCLEINTFNVSNGINIIGNGQSINAGGQVVVVGNLNLPSLTASLPLKLNGANNVISQLISLTADVTGVLPVANGGTNSSTALNNNRVMYSTAGQIRELGAGTNGQVIVGATGAAPAFATLTSAGGTVTFTPGANTLNLEAKTGITTLAAVGAAPNANGATISGGGSTLNLEPASSTQPGVVTTGTQFIAGQKRFDTGIFFLNAAVGYIPSVLTYYEDFNTNITFSGAFAAPVVASIRFTRIGNAVTCLWPNVFAAAGTATTITSPVGSIPARVAPVGSNVAYSIYGRTNTIDCLVTFIILTNGSFTVYFNDLAGSNSFANFANTGLCGFGASSASYPAN